MVDHGTYLSVDEAEATVADLLRAVREGCRPVRILSRGEAVAEVNAVRGVKPRRPLPRWTRSCGRNSWCRATN